MPAFQRLAHLLPRLPILLLAPNLQLRLRQRPLLLPLTLVLTLASRLRLRVGYMLACWREGVVGRVWVFWGFAGGGGEAIGGRVDGDVHLFDAAEVRGLVFGEAAGYEGARGVVAGEEVVGAAGAVAVGYPLVLGGVV